MMTMMMSYCCRWWDYCEFAACNGGCIFLVVDGIVVFLPQVVVALVVSMMLSFLGQLWMMMCQSIADRVICDAQN